MNNRKKRWLIVALPAGVLLLALSVLFSVTACLYSPVYLGRLLTHWDASVNDHSFFPYRTVEAGDQPYSYKDATDPSLGDLRVEYTGGGKTRTADLRSFLENTDTASLIIVQNDRVVYEQYANGYDRNSVNTSFSMAKSVVSLLIGKAIEEGKIRSVSQPISDYITEFAGLDIGTITIEELLLMRSDIAYDEDQFLWFGDDSLTYWHPDLRALALGHTELTDRYQGNFHYNNYHPLLLGIILERSTGVSVSEYFSEKLWKPIGAEQDATWSLDSETSGFEKMESGINFCAMDFIKLGSMVLHGGNWNGAQVIGTDWLAQSTLCPFPINAKEYEGSFLEGRNIGYRYMWYSMPSDRSGYDVFAWGRSDQLLYISPANGTVILRTGKSDGSVSDWAEVLQKLSCGCAGHDVQLRAANCQLDFAVNKDVFWNEKYWLTD